MPRVYFALRQSPDSPFVDLDDWLVRVPAEIEASAENNFNEFRGTQFSLTLDDLDGTFSTTDGQHYLTGGEEISVWIGPPDTLLPNSTTAVNGSKLWWSGTVDKSSLPRSQDSKLLTIRVLQHGAGLNQIYAGLPDWQVVDGELVVDQDTRHRWKGQADNWRVVRDEQSQFLRNEIEEENQTVYFTPSALNAVTDQLYKDRFTTKTHIFHTAGPNVGDIEYPFPRVIATDTGLPEYSGQFKPHLYPDFAAAPNDWDQETLTQPSGAFLRNKAATLVFRRQPVADIVAYLVAEFNRTAQFPLLFDPDTDCIIISPVIQQQIEMLERQPNVDFVDLWLSPATLSFQSQLYALVNYRPNEGAPAGSVSIYSIENETELNPLLEGYALPASFGGDNSCFSPPYRNGLHWSRMPYTTGVRSHAYAMRWNLFSVPAQGGAAHYTLRFDLLWFDISNSTLQIRGPFNGSIVEDLGEFTDVPLDQLVVKRAVAFSVGGSVTVRTDGQPNAPEPDPQHSLQYNNRNYTSRQGGLTVSGALFDRVAVDAENTKLSALLAELAKLTFSRILVTPDRRLKFISRQAPGANIHRISSDMLVGELTSGRATYDDVQLPSFGSGLVLPDNFKQAARVWYEDQVKGQTSFETELGIAAEDTTELPLPHDTILPPAEELPELPKNQRTTKYGLGYCADRVTLDTSNAVFRIAASQPLI